MNRKDAAIAHRFELLAQGHRLLASLPRVQHAVLRLDTFQSGNRVVDRIDAGCDDETVVTKHLAAGESDSPRHRVDGDSIAGDDLYTVLAQAVVIECERRERARAAEHEVTQWTGNELPC